MVQRLDASVQEHVVVARGPHVRSLAVVKLGVHVNVDVLVTRELLHQGR